MVTTINLEQIYQVLLIALAFLFPLTVSGGNILAITIIVLWLFSGDYRSKIDQILDNKVSLACLAFFGMHVVGLLWTDDIEWGLHIIKKMWKLLLLLPILLTITRNTHRQKYMSAFLLAMTISELCSYLIWFEVIPPFKHATVGNPTPFIDHISYNPLLAFAVYLLSHELLMNKCLSKVRRYTYLVFAITMSINMFITGGRAGHVMYFSMLVIVIFQYFETRKITAFFTALIVVPAVFLAAYQMSPLFKQRTDLAVHTVVDYLEKNNRVENLYGAALTNLPAKGKNMIINGAMNVAQRGTSHVTPDGSTGIYAIGPNTFKYFNNTVLSTISQSTNAPAGFSYSYKWNITSTANPAGGDFMILKHIISGHDVQNIKKGTSGALPVTLSFWVRSNKTGVGQVNLHDNTNSRMVAGTYSISSSNTWEKKTVIFPADTTGVITNNNGAGMQIEWWVDSGRGFKKGTAPSTWSSSVDVNKNASGTLGLADSTANNWYITGVQLEIGSVATDFEYRSYNEELALCQSYMLENESNSPTTLPKARFRILGTSLGQRMTFTINSWEIFKSNPLFGVGTGDFPSEYKKINQINTPHQPNTVNPHNMYVLEAVQFGLLGLFGLLAIFYYQFRSALSSSDRFILDVGTALPALFMIIIFAESYLLGHFTTFLFTFFSSFLYKTPQPTAKA